MYYISSLESYYFDEPKEIELVHLISLKERTYIKAKISPPIIGQPYGLGDKDIDFIILLARHIGKDLSRLDSLPMDVYILYPKDNISYENLNKENLDILAWATLYNNFKDAKEHKIAK